jgi:hypothetical protein
MVLGWDLQNSRNWLVVAIHQKSYHVGDLSATEPTHNKLGISRDTTLLHDFHSASRLFFCLFLKLINA